MSHILIHSSTNHTTIGAWILRKGLPGFLLTCTFHFGWRSNPIPQPYMTALNMCHEWSIICNDMRRRSCYYCVYMQLNCIHTYITICVLIQWNNALMFIYMCVCTYPPMRRSFPIDHSKTMSTNVCPFRFRAGVQTKCLPCTGVGCRTAGKVARSCGYCHFLRLATRSDLGFFHGIKHDSYSEKHREDGLYLNIWAGCMAAADLLMVIWFLWSSVIRSLMWTTSWFEDKRGDMLHTKASTESETFLIAFLWIPLCITMCY